MHFVNCRESKKNMPTPESLARQTIDQNLTAAGWIVQDFKALNLGAEAGVAVREFQTALRPFDYGQERSFDYAHRSCHPAIPENAERGIRDEHAGAPFVASDEDATRRRQDRPSAQGG
jgi:hypothetical protein